MKALKFDVTIVIPEGSTPYQSPEIQAGIIAEIIRHRTPFLVGGGGAEVSVRPAEVNERSGQ